MQFNAILSPCNRWDNVQNKRFEKRNKTEAAKKTGGNFGNKAEKSDWDLKKNHITHDPYTRNEDEQRQTNKQKVETVATEIQTDVHLHTSHLQK